MSNFNRPSRSLFIRPQSQLQTRQDMANYVPNSRQGSFSTISTRMIQYLKSWVGKIFQRQNQQNSAQLTISQSTNAIIQPVDDSKVFKDINIRSHIIQEQDYILKPQPKQHDSDQHRRRPGRISFKIFLKDDQKENEIKSPRNNQNKDMSKDINEQKNQIVQATQNEIKITDGRIFKKQKLNGKRSSLNLILRSKKQYYRQTQKQLEREEVIDFGVVQVKKENLNDLSISESSDDEELQSAIPKFNNDVNKRSRILISKEKEQLSLIEDCQMLEQEVLKKRQSLNNSFSSRIISDFPQQKAQFIWKGMQTNNTPKRSNEDQKQILEFFKAPVKEVENENNNKLQQPQQKLSPKPQEKKSPKILPSHSIQLLFETQEKKTIPPVISLEPTQQKLPQSPINNDNTHRKQAIDIFPSISKINTQNSPKNNLTNGEKIGFQDIEKQHLKQIQQTKEIFNQIQPQLFGETVPGEFQKSGITKSESYQFDMNKGEIQNLDKIKVQKDELKKPQSLFSNLTDAGGSFKFENKPSNFFGGSLKQTESTLFNFSTQIPAVGLSTPQIPSKNESQKEDNQQKLDDSKSEIQKNSKHSLFGSLLEINKLQEPKDSLFQQLTQKQDQNNITQTENLTKEDKEKQTPQISQNEEKLFSLHPPKININGDQKVDPKLETPQKNQIENPFMKASPLVDQKHSIAQLYSAPPNKFNEQGQDAISLTVPQTFPQAKTDIFASQQGNLLQQNQANPFLQVQQSNFNVSFQQSQPSQFQQLFTPMSVPSQQASFFNQQYQSINTSYSQSQDQSMDIDEPNSSQQLMPNQQSAQFLFQGNQQNQSLFGFGISQNQGGEALFQQPQFNSQGNNQFLNLNKGLFRPQNKESQNKLGPYVGKKNLKNKQERIT